MAGSFAIGLAEKGYERECVNNPTWKIGSLKISLIRMQLAPLRSANSIPAATTRMFLAAHVRCPYCRQRARKEGVDLSDAEQMATMQRRSTVEFNEKANLLIRRNAAARGLTDFPLACDPGSRFCDDVDDAALCGGIRFCVEWAPGGQGHSRFAAAFRGGRSRVRQSSCMEPRLIYRCYGQASRPGTAGHAGRCTMEVGLRARPGGFRGSVWVCTLPRIRDCLPIDGARWQGSHRDRHWLIPYQPREFQSRNRSQFLKQQVHLNLLPSSQSLYWHFKRLIRLRNQLPALSDGKLESVDLGHPGTVGLLANGRRQFGSSSTTCRAKTRPSRCPATWKPTAGWSKVDVTSCS